MPGAVAAERSDKPPRLAGAPREFKARGTRRRAATRRPPGTTRRRRRTTRRSAATRRSTTSGGRLRGTRRQRTTARRRCGSWRRRAATVSRGGGGRTAFRGSGGTGRRSRLRRAEPRKQLLLRPGNHGRRGKHGHETVSSRQGDVPAPAGCVRHEQGRPRRCGAARRDRDHGCPENPRSIGTGPRHLHNRLAHHLGAVVAARSGSLLRGHHVPYGPGQFGHRDGYHVGVRRRRPRAAARPARGRGACRSRRRSRADAMQHRHPGDQRRDEANGDRDRCPACGNPPRERNGPPTAEGNPGDTTPAAALHDPPDLTAEVPQWLYRPGDAGASQTVNYADSALKCCNRPG